jgi:transposase
MIRIEAIWLATEPIDMRAGVDTALARVVKVFGAAKAHHAYLFANRRANRMKVLVHDGFGLWLCARRLHQGHFVWPHSPTSTSVPGTHDAPPSLTLSRAQLDALVLGLPWQRLADAGAGAGAIHII